MQCIRRGKHSVGLSVAHRSLFIFGELAGVLLDTDLCTEAEIASERRESLLLVVDERALGCDIERSTTMIDSALKRRDGVCEALPAGGRRREDDVLVVADGFDGADLMLIELIDIAPRERHLYPIVEIEIRECGFTSGDAFVMLYPALML